MSRSLLFAFILLIVAFVTFHTEATLLDKKKHKKWVHIDSAKNLNGIRRPTPRARGTPVNPELQSLTSVQKMLDAASPIKNIKKNAARAPIAGLSTLKKSQEAEKKKEAEALVKASLYDSKFPQSSLVNRVTPEELHFGMALMADAAYSIESTRKVLDLPLFGGCEPLTVFTQFESPVSAIRWLILTSKKLNAAFLLFRGTQNEENVIQDLKASLVDCVFQSTNIITDVRSTAMRGITGAFNHFNQGTGSSPNGLCHQGFLESWNEIRASIFDCLGALGGKVSDNPLCGMKASPFTSNKFELYVSGHSLGGAMSVLATLDIAQSEALRPKLASIYTNTVGQPLVGNQRFVNTFTKSLLGSAADKMANGGPEFPVAFARFVNRVDSQVDVVAKVPMEAWDYRHVGPWNYLDCPIVKCNPQDVQTFHSAHFYVGNMRNVMFNRIKKNPASCPNMPATLPYLQL